MTRLVDSYDDPTNIRHFRKFIRQVLVFTVNKEHDPRDEMTTAENMRIWINAFTHKTEDFDRNYESLEYLGDEAMGMAFKSYVYQTYGIKSSDRLSNLKNYYLSENYQPYMAEKMNIKKWILIDQKVPLTDKILEDVVESFFGAVYVIGRKLHLHDPSIYLHPIELVYRFFFIYFTGEGFDPSRGDFVYTTQLGRYYHFFAGVLIDPYYDRVKNKYILSKDFFEGIVSKSPSTEIGTRITKEIKALDLESMITGRMKTTKDRQATAIIKIFLKEGITPDFLKEQANTLSFRGDIEIDKIAKANKFNRFILERYISEESDDESTVYYIILAQWNNFKTKKSMSLKIDIIPYTKDLKQRARKIIIERYGAGK